MTTRPQLFLLAIDHRRSIERLLGVEEPVGAPDRERILAAKALVAQALGDVVAARAGADHGEQLGILVDDEYGAGAIASARRAGVAVALAFERSARTVLEFEHDDWRDRLVADPPTMAKVLVRHRADGVAHEVATQLARLGEISDACAQGSVEFLLELLTPFTDAEEEVGAERLELDVRPRLVTEAIEQMRAAGVDPDVWKVEGVADADACAGIADAARRGGRDDVRIVVLGAGAPQDTVDRWLVAAAAGGYDGFAVGRSIWADAVLAHEQGDLDAAAARSQVATRYASFIDTFTAAART
jgi:myo-inositol catabolism protein IolC